MFYSVYHPEYQKHDFSSVYYHQLKKSSLSYLQSHCTVDFLSDNCH